ncbi:putative quercetin 2,3-dioxygenase PA1205 [Burkholderia multivorans]
MNTHTSANATASESGPQAAERYPARVAEVGSLPLRRALPNRHRKTVGAWCFLDHAGPVALSADGGMHVGPHPHIGLQTFTWMIEGSVLHRDSLGCEQVILPGEVNLMTAGRGITHTEDTVSPDGAFHAVQLWIALPEAQLHRAAAFRNYKNLPVHRDGGFDVTVLAGRAFGLESPAEIHTPLVGLDFSSVDKARISMPLDPAFEYAVLVLSGDVSVDGEALAPDVLLYVGTGRSQFDLRADSAARFVVLGGAPFEEDVLMWWNFVARTSAEMVEAVTAWNAHRVFGDVPGVTAPRLSAPELPPTWK